MTQKPQPSTKQKDLEDPGNKFWLNVPIRAVIYPTNECNYRCNHCYASSFDYQELSLKKYKTIFKKLRDWGVFEIVFLGGEPFMRKDFLDMATEAKSLGFGLKVSTNASLINQTNIKDIHNLFNGRIQVSLDSTVEEINDKIRGVGSFQKTTRGIEALLANNSEFSLGVVINKLNYPTLFGVYEYCNKKEIKGLHIMRIMPKGRAFDNWAELNLTNEEWINTVINLRKVAKPSGPRLQIDGTYEYSNSIEPLGKCISGCEAGRYEITIMSDGTVVVCDMFNELEIGDINKINLEKEWAKNPLYDLFRNSKRNLTGKCSYCEVNFCTGCRFQAYTINKEFCSEDPFCVRKDLLKKNE